MDVHWLEDEIAFAESRKALYEQALEDPEIRGEGTVLLHIAGYGGEIRARAGRPLPRSLSSRARSYFQRARSYEWRLLEEALSGMGMPVPEPIERGRGGYPPFAVASAVSLGQLPDKLGSRILEAYGKAEQAHAAGRRALYREAVALHGDYAAFLRAALHQLHQRHDI